VLFRRVAEHVKAQNWTAVFIDFVIVVVGVFIGIQVANWNEARVDEARLTAQLSSFRDELILAREDLAARQAYYEARIASAAEVRERLENDPDLTLEEFNQLTVSALRGSGLNVRFRGFDEITATGAISKVADRELRDLLYQWDTSRTTIRNADALLEEARNSFIIPVVLRETDFGSVLRADDRYQNALAAVVRFGIDIDSMRANKELDSALAMRHVQAMQQLSFLKDFIETTNVLIAALEAGGA